MQDMMHIKNCQPFFLPDIFALVYVKPDIFGLLISFTLKRVKLYILFISPVFVILLILLVVFKVSSHHSDEGTFIDVIIMSLTNPCVQHIWDVLLDVPYKRPDLYIIYIHTYIQRFYIQYIHTYTEGRVSLQPEISLEIYFAQAGHVVACGCL